MMLVCLLKIDHHRYRTRPFDHRKTVFGAQKHFPFGEFGTALPSDIGQLQKTSQLQFRRKLPLIAQ